MKSFTIFGKPMGKQRPKVTFTGKYARAYSPKETVSYENLVKLSYQDAEGSLDFEQPIWMQIICYYPIPTSFSKKKKSAAIDGLIHPIVKPDVDNVAKIICDALNGIAYKDDNQIITLEIEKKYGAVPRVVVNLINIKEEE